jgi:geranylgeranyl diphosphate synthase type I
MKHHMNSPILQKMRNSIEQDLRVSLNSLQHEYETVMVEMIAYHLGWNETENQSSGKRIRPLITLLCCAALGGDWPAALPAASAIELIHNFSLVHDDIEDNSGTRRGRPTIWKKWGIPKAINLGDSIFVLSRLACYRLEDANIPTDRIVNVLRSLDEACLELTIGQHMDLSFEAMPSVELEAYIRMIQGKTSALIAAAATSGGIIAGAEDPEIELLFKFGYHLGLAFQIRDDILGIWGRTSVTGKPTDDDLLSRKKTLPILYGLNKIQEFRELWDSGREDVELLAALRSALESSTVLQYCNEMVDSHTQSAISALRSLNGEDPYQQELQLLTRGLLNRDQ